MNQFSVRDADATDREGFARLYWKVFEPDLPYEDVLEKDLVNDWNDRGLDERACVAEMDGMIRSNVSFFINKENVIRGTSLKLGGIWAVATEESYRKMGMLSSILKMVFSRMRDEGAVVSIVDPDRQLFQFYERFGYGLFESAKIYELRPDSLRATKSTVDITHREMVDKNEWSKILQVQKAMYQLGSRAFSIRREAEYLIESGNCHLLERESEPVGAMKFSVAKEENVTWLNIWPATCFASLDIFPALIDVIKDLAKSVQTIRWFCGTESPVLHYTQGPQTVLARDWGNMMMRVVDFPAFCESIDVPKTATGKCIIKIIDEHCPWNEGTYMISPSNGRLNVEPTDKESEVALDALNLSRITGGYTTATTLHGLGEIDCSRKTAENLEAIFPSDSFFSHYRF
jgi:predicted acetyltransferase